jgi:DNA-binding PadR family transcriptional regulator
VGQLFKGRYLSRLLKQNMTVVNPILDRLEERGHIEKVDERGNKRGPAAAVYRVRTLDWMGDFRPKPTSVQAEPIDDYVDTLPDTEEPELEPDLSEDETTDPAEEWWRE